MDWPFFDARERALIAEALPEGGAARKGLEVELGRLATLAELTRHAVSALSPAELLARLGDVHHDAELRVPPVAALGRAFLVLKIGFFRGLGVGLEAAGAAAEVRRRAEAELAQSIHSYLVEELFLVIAVDHGLAEPVRRAAAAKLLTMWSDPMQVEIDDVAPLLDAIWDARRRMRPVIGTLLGTQEIVTLFQNTRDERFLDHFAEDVPEEELQAYREFLFGMSTEQCDRLRSEMNARGLDAVSLTDAHRILGSRDPDLSMVGQIGPDAMVASYRARKLKAQYRALVDAPGPRRTAEEHVVIARLARGDAL